MRTAIGLAAVVAVLTAAPARSEPVVVSGTVKTTRAVGGTVRLEFENPSTPEVVLLIGWLSSFPPSPAEFYAGRTISARGAQRSFRGAAEVWVRDASDITVLNAADSSEVGAPSAPDEIQTLRAQNRTLQDRVRQLEDRLRERDSDHE